MPYAIALHALFATWIYSAVDEKGTPVFPQPHLSPEVETFARDFVEDNAKPGTTEYELLQRFNVVGRVLNWVVFPMFCFVVLQILYLIVWPVVKKTPVGLFCISLCRRSGKVAAEVEGNPPYSKAIAEGTLKGPPDYSIANAPSYADAFKGADKSLYSSGSSPGGLGPAP